MKDKYIIRYLASILGMSLLFLISIELNSKETYDTNTYLVDPINICQFQLTINNSRDQAVDLYKIGLLGAPFRATTIEANDTYITRSNDNQIWFVCIGTLNDCDFYQEYNPSGCDDQVFEIQPDYKCLNELIINNNGNCRVSLYKKKDAQSYNAFETNIPANGTYTVLSYEDEKWQAVIGGFGNLISNDSYTVTGCDSQTFNINPDCPCTIDFKVQNTGLCTVHLYKIQNGTSYIASIPRGESYITKSCFNERWLVIVCDSQNILFDETYIVSRIGSQVFNVSPKYCPCNENSVFIQPIFGYQHSDANNSITGGTNNSTQYLSNVTYQAGSIVRLNPNFTANLGSTFRAFIEPNSCSSTGCILTTPLSNRESDSGIIEKSIINISSNCESFDLIEKIMYDSLKREFKVLFVCKGDIDDAQYVIIDNINNEVIDSGKENSISFGPYLEGDSYSYTVSLLDKPECSITSAKFIENGKFISNELSDFTVQTEDNEDVIKWTANSNSSIKYFILEYSKNEIDFEMIKAWQAGTYVSFGQSYSESVEGFNSGVYYYRLKAIDFDDNIFIVSNTVKIDRHTEQLSIYNIYPIPTTNLLNIQFNTKTANNLTIKIIDITGKNLIEEEYNSRAGINRLTLDVGFLSTGTYFLNISDGTHLVVKKIIKE